MKRIKLSINNSNGMTIPELALVMLMFSSFLSIYLMSAKYIQTSLKNFQKADENSEGLVVDNHKISLAMEDWALELSQAAYSRSEISNLGCRYPDSNGQKVWNITSKAKLPLPNNYQYCVLATSLSESPLINLIKRYSLGRLTFINTK